MSEPRPPAADVPADVPAGAPSGGPADAPADAPAGGPAAVAASVPAGGPADAPADAPAGASQDAAGVAPRPAPPAGRPRGRQTALDMVRSMVLIVAAVGVVLLLAPQPDAVEQPQVSAAEAAVALEQATIVLGTTPLLPGPGRQGDGGAEPGADPGGATGDGGVPAEAVVALGEDWRLDYARTEETDEVDTWRVGVLSPDGRRVDLEQAVDPTEEWLTRADAGRPGLPEPTDVGGLTWTVQERGDGDTSWTWVDPDGLTTAVSASSASADLRTVVEAVSAALRR